MSRSDAITSEDISDIQRKPIDDSEYRNYSAPYKQLKNKVIEQFTTDYLDKLLKKQKVILPYQQKSAVYKGNLFRK